MILFGVLYPKHQVPYYNGDPKRNHNFDNHLTEPFLVPSMALPEDRPAATYPLQHLLMPQTHSLYSAMLISTCSDM